MKKTITISLIIIMVISLCSCAGQRLTDNTVATIGTLPTSSVIPTGNITTNPTQGTTNTVPTSNNPTTPTTVLPTDGNGNVEVPTVPTEPVNYNNDGSVDLTPQVIQAGFNDNYKEDGTVIDRRTNGNQSTYYVRYTRALTLIVDIIQSKTDVGTQITVNVYLQHFAIYFAKGKIATLSIGNQGVSAQLGELDYEDQIAARTSILSYTRVVPSGESVVVSFNVPFLGTYGGKYVENISFSQSIATI